MRLLTFFITVITCSHLVSCLWVIAASLEDFNYNTWIFNANLVDAGNIDIYLASIYWTFSTMLTVGYGDVHANSTEEMVLAICWMLIGGMFYTFAIGNLASLLSNLDTRES